MGNREWEHLRRSQSLHSIPQSLLPIPDLPTATAILAASAGAREDAERLGSHTA